MDVKKKKKKKKPGSLTDMVTDMVTDMTGWFSSRMTEIGCLFNWLIDRLTDTDWLVDCLSH